MKKLIFISVLSFAFIANAQEKPKSNSFSLDEAINYALSNNYAAINSQRDIAAAKSKKWETTAMGLPQINANLDYQNNFELQKSLIPAQFFGGNPGEFAEVAFGTKHNMNARTTLSQLLFDGSYIVAVQASKTYLKFYQNSKEKTDQEVKEMVINAYGNVLLAEESILILEKNKEILEKTLFDSKETFKNGLIEEENVEQLQITLSTINSNLNNVKRLREIALNMLKISLGLNIDDELKLKDKLDNLAVKNLDSAFTQTEFSPVQNIYYQMALNFQEQRNLELKLQKTKALPSLAAVVNVGYNAFGNQFQFFTSNQKWLNYSNMGVSLSVPIFSSFARNARTQQAKIDFDKAQINLIQTTQKVYLELETAKVEYQYSIEEFETSKEIL